MGDVVLFPDLVERAGKGDVEAMRELGYNHLNIDKSSKLAYEFFYRAANKDDPESQYRIGAIHFYGLAQQEKNLDKAGEWLLKAYNNRYMASMVELGLMIEEGYVFSPNAFPYRSAKQCYNDAYNRHNLEKAKEQLDRILHQEDNNSKGPLSDLIGLESIKSLLGAIKKHIEFDAKRRNAGLKSRKQSHHFAFMGNPGTGKTEVARHIGTIFKDLGVLNSGHVVEVDRADLVGEWKGETSAKTKAIIESALDGVLFVDEAHMVDNDGAINDWGSEALSLILKAMEDHRERLVVILAGYEDGIKRLLRSNPGFHSRVKHQLVFPDYSAEELVEIYRNIVTQEQYILTQDACVCVQKLMSEAKKLYDKNFGNGRFARNAFEKTIEKLATRVMNNDLKGYDHLQFILFTDIPTISEMTNKQLDKATHSNNVHNLGE